MPVTISTNSGAAVAARALDNANSALTDSLKRLSTGNRIANNYDDAAGVAVEQKLAFQGKQYDVLKNNIQNAVSFADTQQGVLSTAMNLASRLGELQAMASDTTKSSDDKALYQTEATALGAAFTQIAAQKFNGNDMFVVASAQTINVNLNATPGTISMGDEDLTAALTVADYADITVVTAATVEADIQAIATLQATVGSKQSVLGYYYDNAVVTQQNVAAARGRIVDTDIATESGVYAKNQILAQAASAMLAQANQIGAQSALTLLL
jgi:flagellin